MVASLVYPAYVSFHYLSCYITKSLHLNTKENGELFSLPHTLLVLKYTILTNLEKEKFSRTSILILSILEP
jgi:hypothetical protein